MISSVSCSSLGSVLESYRVLVNLIEQLEQIIEALQKLISQIETSVSDLEYMYDLLLLYPENSSPNDFDQLLATYSLQRNSALEQQVNNMIVTMQSNRKDIEKEIDKMENSDEVHTKNLTKTKLFLVLQTFTELIERYALIKNQFQIKFKRILSKQVKFVNISFTERALDRILEVDLTDEMIVFEKSNLIFRSSKTQPIQTVSQESQQDELDAIKQNLSKLIKNINKTYLSINGLFISSNTFFKQFCLICELVVKHNVVAEVKEISFNEIVDFTARVANKMKTDYQLEYATPILLPKKSKFKCSKTIACALLLLSLFVVLSVLLFVELIILNDDYPDYSKLSD